MSEELIGQRVSAVHFTTDGTDWDDNQTVPPGTEGTVRSVDCFGTLHVDWDNGSTIGLLRADKYEVIG